MSNPQTTDKTVYSKATGQPIAQIDDLQAILSSLATLSERQAETTRAVYAKMQEVQKLLYEQEQHLSLSLFIMNGAIQQMTGFPPPIRPYEAVPVFGVPCFGNGNVFGGRPLQWPQQQQQSFSYVPVTPIAPPPGLPPGGFSFGNQRKQ